MSWLTEFQDDIVALEEARNKAFPVDLNDEN